jgi:hypothetical protein
MSTQDAELKVRAEMNDEPLCVRSCIPVRAHRLKPSLSFLASTPSGRKFAHLLRPATAALSDSLMNIAKNAGIPCTGLNCLPTM